MAVNIPLSELVRLHRKAAGLSRNDLAVLAGVGKTVLYDLEHGKMTVRLDTLLKILRTLKARRLRPRPVRHLPQRRGGSPSPPGPLQLSGR
ncbi:MAG: helix-turn-helix domain-containing protein [Candidatus Eremiobacterota bacterium]